MIVLLLATLAFDLHGQPLPISEPTKQFSMFYGNDVTAQRDLYFTNGWAFEYIHPVFSKSPFNINFFKKSESFEVFHSLRLIYDVFTPDLHKELFTDRPFSAYILLGSKHQYVIHKSKLRLTSELQVGVIGEAAAAATLQNALHHIMPGADPINGWETQIKNDIAINYHFQLDKQFFRNEVAEITGGASTSLGTPYTKADLYTMLRLGFMEDYFNRLNTSSQKAWQLYIFGEVKGSYVLHNATIQGGLLNAFNIYIRNDLSPFVMDFQLGVGSVYKNFGLNFGQHFLTKEFDAGNSHSWGYFSFYINH